MKKLAIIIVLLTFILILNPGLMEALDISGEFTLGSSYDFDENNYLNKRSELKLNFRSGTFSEAFNIDVILENIWPEDELKVGLDEVYFNYYGSNYDLRAGKQLVSWGTASGYNPTDNINSPNLEEPTGDKNSLLMIRGDYYFNRDYRFTGVLVPYHSPPMTGERKVSAENMPEDEEKIPVEYVTVNIEDPDYDLSSIEAAFKLSGRNVEGFDFSMSAYYGHEKLPALIKEERTIEGTPPDEIEKVSVPGYYQRLTVLGADMVTDYEGVGIWMEGAYMIPEESAEYGSLVLGADYHLETGQLLLGQAIYRQDRMKEDNYLIQSAIETTFADYHSAQVAAFYNFTAEEYLLRPEISFSLADAVNFDIEYIYQSGDIFSAEQNFRAPDRNELTTTLSYSF